MTRKEASQTRGLELDKAYKEIGKLPGLSDDEFGAHTIRDAIARQQNRGQQGLELKNAG